MSFLDALRHRFSVLVKGNAHARALDEEMRFHLALDAEQEEANGLSPSAARDMARRHFSS
jgi:hypothetical protein